MTLKEPTEAAIRRDLSATVHALALPEGRRVGKPGHERAKNYLSQRLEDMGCLPYRGNSFELPYKGRKLSFCNLAGVIPGQDRKAPPVLIGAHYDSVIDAPCADDNAAAVAITLKLGELFQRQQPARDILLALFDAEEPPFFQTSTMGSERFYKDQMDRRGVHAALVMDLVGHAVELSLGDHPIPAPLASLLKLAGRIPPLGNLLFVTGAESHPEWQNVIANAGKPSRLPLVFALNRYIGDMSDHGVFRTHHVPYLFLSCGRWQHYHEPSDTPDRLDYRKMAKITRYAEKLVEGISQSGKLAKVRTKVNTIELEITHLQQTLGPLLPLLLGKLDKKSLKTRADLDALAGLLLEGGL